MKITKSKKEVRTVQKIEVPAINEQERTACVHRLNELAEMECRDGWLEKGRAVLEYVARIKADPTLKQFDAFRLLASHPDSLHKAQQLRHFAACYELYQQFDGEQFPNLTMTHFVCVLGSTLNRGAKQALLVKANAEKLSVAGLKGAILASRQPHAMQQRTWESECKLVASRAARLLADLSSLHTARGKMEPKPELAENLVLVLENLAKYMADHFATDSNRMEPVGAGAAAHD